MSRHTPHCTIAHRVLSLWLPRSIGWFLAGLILTAGVASAESPLELGDRREPFVDSWFIGELNGDAEQRLHHPTPRGVVLRTDRPWEGNTSAYFTIFRDDERYRMYYRGSGNGSREVVCYAVSDDGIHWRKPTLELVEFDGSKQNNIIHDGRGEHNYGHNFTPFKDGNPDAETGARYKAVASTHGMFAFTSPDGVDWQQLRDEPIIPSSQGAFDSQNLVFWDAAWDEYRAYWRDFRDGRRAIRTASSEDFINWTEPEWLRYQPDTAKRHLYTNQVMPHPRAPHIVIGFPSRYLGNRGSLVEGLFMSSRDRITFHRWEEAFIRPGPNRDKWQNRSNYIWWGLVETETKPEGTPAVWSLYANEGYYKGNDSSIRRYTIRKDGFVSIQASMEGGQFISRPFTFAGDTLTLNVATSAAGAVRVEFQTPDGRPIEDRTLSDCDLIYGDSLNRTVKWNGESNVGHLAGRPVQLRIKLKDADLYSLRFQ